MSSALNEHMAVLGLVGFKDKSRKKDKSFV
jgi:hypothetical protein